MTPQDPDNRELVELIQDSWAPPPTDADAFDARLQGRLQGRKRRRAAVAGGGAVLVLAVLGSHLLGGFVQEPVPVAEAPASAPAPTVVQAEQDAEPVFWSQALDHDQRGFELPGAYGALDTLFLQPLDQEL